MGKKKMTQYSQRCPATEDFLGGGKAREKKPTQSGGRGRA